MESIVSNTGDKLLFVAREANVAHQLSKDTNNRADDMVIRLRHNNISIVGPLEKSEGRDPTSFVEAWLIDVFGEGSLYTAQAHPSPSPTLKCFLFSLKAAFTSERQPRSRVAAYFAASTKLSLFFFFLKVFPLLSMGKRLCRLKKRVRDFFSGDKRSASMRCEPSP